MSSGPGPYSPLWIILKLTCSISLELASGSTYVIVRFWRSLAQQIRFATLVAFCRNWFFLPLDSRAPQISLREVQTRSCHVLLSLPVFCFETAWLLWEDPLQTHEACGCVYFLQIRRSRAESLNSSKSITVRIGGSLSELRRLCQSAQQCVSRASKLTFK